jgi:hypothetical protein
MKYIASYSNAVGSEIDSCISLPVHNMENLIGNVISSINRNVSTASHLVIILDGCQDTSKDRVLSQIEDLKAQKKLRINISVFESRRNLFESKCDSFTASLFPMAKQFISVQADMVIDDVGFDKRFLEILERNPDIFMVSGRGTHAWEFPHTRVSYGSIIHNEVRDYFRKWRKVSRETIDRAEEIRPQLTLSDSDFYQNLEFGRCGRNHNAWISNSKSNLLYLSETVMRGPLAIRMSNYIELGGFNTKSHPLGNDDHELALRGWKMLGLRTSYHPVEYRSDLSWGTTRKRRSIRNTASFIKMKMSESANFRFSLLSQGLGSEDHFPPREIRYLSESESQPRSKNEF